MNLEFTLPLARENEITQCFGHLTNYDLVKFEPVGRWFESYCSRQHHKHTLSHTSSISSSSEEEAEEGEFDQDDSIILTLDPKEWKNQDHYAVLGLSKLRWKATEEMIKKAYKRKVLQHHPDKRRAAGIPVKAGEEDYFTCVTRAYEVLGVPQKRRSYDSIDPLFDDSIPSVSSESKTNFFELFRSVFERNSRWYIKSKQKVPQLGDASTPFNEVNRFYNFWYNFESWREYSYLDEEEKEKGENRDERRWIEKQNKASRMKLKKEETMRIRQLVDNAYTCDPRIIKFKQDEKDKKLAEKKAKQDALRKKTEEEEKKKQDLLEAERAIKLQEEEAQRLLNVAQKKEKEAWKNKLKKEKKQLRTIIKEWDYLSIDENERVKNMADLDKLIDFSTLEVLQNFNELTLTGDKQKSKEFYLQKVEEMNHRIDEDKRIHFETTQQITSQNSTAKNNSEKVDWSEEELQCLIKAVNLFPAGTNARWETIANFIKLHVPNSNRNAKDTLAKAKNLQKNDLSLKEDANKKAFQIFSRDNKGSACVEVQDVSERYETAAETQVYEVGSNPAPWSADEQKLLEQAMRTYPASEPDRWDKISSCISARSKKDCMMRYKELVELIRLKKLAQVSTSTNKKK